MIGAHCQSFLLCATATPRALAWNWLNIALPFLAVLAAGTRGASPSPRFLFGAVDALQLRLQSAGVIDVPYQVFLMLPFVVTIVAMAVFARTAQAPAALLVPFRKEER